MNAFTRWFYPRPLPQGKFWLAMAAAIGLSVAGALTDRDGWYSKSMQYGFWVFQGWILCCLLAMTRRTMQLNKRMREYDIAFNANMLASAADLPKPPTDDEVMINGQDWAVAEYEKRWREMRERDKRRRQRGEAIIEQMKQTMEIWRKDP